jgi:hypothetical protein
MRIIDLNSNQLVIDIAIEIFLSQGGEMHYRRVYQQDNPTQLDFVRDIRYEFTVAEISRAATDHIYKYYPIWKQFNIGNFGNQEEKTKLENFINRVRVWCDSENPQIFDNSLDQILP